MLRLIPLFIPIERSMRIIHIQQLISRQRQCPSQSHVSCLIIRTFTMAHFRLVRGLIGQNLIYRQWAYRRCRDGSANQRTPPADRLPGSGVAPSDAVSKLRTRHPFHVSEIDRIASHVSFATRKRSPDPNPSAPRDPVANFPSRFPLSTPSVWVA